MSYRIVLSGKFEDIYVEDGRGAGIAVDFENGSMPPIIDINGQKISSKLIRAVIPNVGNPDSEDAKERGMAMVGRVNREFAEWRRKRLRLSPKERAQSTAFMDMLSTSIRHRRLTEEEKQEVIAAQEKWFEAHPDFHTANPSCFFSREQIQKIQTTKGDMVSLSEVMSVNSLNYAEKHLNA